MKMVIGRQFGRRSIFKSRTRKDVCRTEKEKQKEDARQKNIQAERDRHNRGVRMSLTHDTIKNLLDKNTAESKRESCRIAEIEIMHLLDLLSTGLEYKDRLWIAQKALWLTSWRGMRFFPEVKEKLKSVFGECMPREIGIRVEELQVKQFEYEEKRKKLSVNDKSPLRLGKTERDKKNGSWAKHMTNKRTKAARQSERNT